MEDKIIGDLEWDSRSNKDFIEILFGDKKDLDSLLIGKTIKSTKSNTIELDDGTLIQLGKLESDGDAQAKAKLLESTKDLVITSINLGERLKEDNNTNKRITLFYNNNREIAKIEFTADKGESKQGVYSSSSGMIINNIGFAIISA